MFQFLYFIFTKKSTKGADLKACKFTKNEHCSRDSKNRFNEHLYAVAWKASFKDNSLHIMKSIVEAKI